MNKIALSGEKKTCEPNIVAKTLVCLTCHLGRITERHLGLLLKARMLTGNAKISLFSKIAFDAADFTTSVVASGWCMSRSYEHLIWTLNHSMQSRHE